MSGILKGIIFFFFCLLILEGGIRVLGVTDADADFFILGRHLKPFHFPASTIQERINDYHQHPHSYVQYDPALGWSLRPSSQSENGLYASNAHGLRGKWTPLIPDENALRIALFGDSFVHGDDVSDENTWAYFLNQRANENQPAQVFNYGVGGYGNDQAFLRYVKEGETVNPKVVIIGFQPENCSRNVNMNRIFYTKSTGIPFFKPRFILGDQNSLQLINQPTPSPEETPGIISNFEGWPLASNEYFYNPADYEEKPWQVSKLLSIVQFLVETIQRKQTNLTTNLLKLDHEGGKLCYTIIHDFVQKAQLDGARVVILHLPFEAYLQKTMNGEPRPYAELWEKLRAEFETVDVEPILLEEAQATPLNEIFIPHYSPKINQKIGACLSNYLRAPNPIPNADWSCPFAS